MSKRFREKLYPCFGMMYKALDIIEEHVSAHQDLVLFDHQTTQVSHLTFGAHS